MGANASTNVSSVLTETATDFFNQSSQSCSASTETNQDVTLNFGAGAKFSSDKVSMTSSSKLNSTCAQEIKNDTKLMEQLQSAVKQAAESKLSGLTVGAQASTNSSNIATKVATAIKNINFQNCNTSMSATQKFVLNADRNSDVSIKELDLSAELSGVSNCIQDAVNSTDLVRQLQSTADQTAVTKNDGLNMNVFVICGLIAFIVFLAFGPIVATQPLFKRV